jgi:hypothetical protein
MKVIYSPEGDDLTGWIPRWVCEMCGCEFVPFVCKKQLPKLPQPNYEALGKEIGSLVSTKQKAYGDAFGKAGEVLRVLYPNGIAQEQYEDLLAVVRVIDKLFRIATDRDALGESPWKDIAGYALLSWVRTLPDATE